MSIAVSTGVGLAIAGAGLGASAASNYLGQRRAGKINERSIDATERSDTRAAEIERERLAEEKRALDAQLAEKKRAEDEKLKYDREEAARKERQYNEAVAMDRQRWQDYLRINEPYWRQGAGVLGSLYDIAGFGGQAPAYAPPTQPTAGTGMPRPTNPPPSPEGLPGTGWGSPNDPADRYRFPERGRPAYPTMPLPSTGTSSLTSLMQLAQLAGQSRMPKPAYTGDVNLSALALG